MSKIANLQIGEYNLALEVNRDVVLKAYQRHPELSKRMVNAQKDEDEMISMEDYVGLCKDALFYMAKSQDSSFTREKADEIFDYAKDCVVEIPTENGESIDYPAQDYLVDQIAAFMNMGFTGNDNAKKIKITLS